MREYLPIFKALGFLGPSLEERKRQFAELQENSTRGRERRLQLQQALEDKKFEFLAQGSDMNQQYESAAVYLEGAGDAPTPTKDAVLYHEPHTYPGMRLPHAWLTTAVPSAQVSTIDLAGKGRYALFTGYGGQKWVEAAAKVTQRLGVEIKAYEIGFGLEYQAVYNSWYHLRETEEDGCVLVRPDNFIAWRSRQCVEDCTSALLQVMQSVLASKNV